MLYYTIHFINRFCLILLNIGILVFFLDFIYSTFKRPWTLENIIIAIMNTIMYAFILSIGLISLWLNITQGFDIWNI